jgi:hypothetical protein
MSITFWLQVCITTVISIVVMHFSLQRHFAVGGTGYIIALIVTVFMSNVLVSLFTNMFAKSPESSSVVPSSYADILKDTSGQYEFPVRGRIDQSASWENSVGDEQANNAAGCPVIAL